MTVTTQVYAGGSLPRALAWQAISFMRCEWPYLFTGTNRLRARVFEELAAAHVVRADGDVLFSYADVVSAEAAIGVDRVTVSGLSNVFTFPPYWNEGHASKIVVAAGEYIDAGSADLAILFCENRMERFYSAYGWQTAAVGTIVAPGDAPGAMIRAGSLHGAAVIANLEHSPLTLSAAW